MENNETVILDYLRKLCSRREYCSHDIREKILKKDPSANPDGLISSLVSEGYLSDSRYAGAFARDKSSISGWGPLKIRQALSFKGISREIVDEALSGIDSQKASDKLLKSLEIKRKALQGDPQIRLKLLRFALSRGYSYDEACAALQKLK